MDLSSSCDEVVKHKRIRVPFPMSEKISNDALWRQSALCMGFSVYFSSNSFERCLSPIYTNRIMMTSIQW